MEKKAKNRVVLRGNVDGNITFFKELEANEKKEEEKQFSTKAKWFCVHACSIRLFHYNRFATNFFRVGLLNRFESHTKKSSQSDYIVRLNDYNREGPGSQNNGPSF